MIKRENLRRILVLDGQGGGMGAQLIRLLLQELPQGCELLCVGTNVLATNAMLKAGCPQGATGENAAIYQAGRADVILGPIGIILANGILGEVPAAAEIILLELSGNAFTWQMFFAGAFLNAIPGIVLQLVFIPAIMVALDRAGMVKFKKSELQGVEVN